MKTLANCSPKEFMRQTILIRRAAEKWIKATDIINIRKRLPVLEVAPKDAEPALKREIAEKNKKKAQEQTWKNVSDILDNSFEKHPDETLEILALCCFVEPSAAEKYPMSYYLGAITELINDEAVMGFFISLVRLGQTDTSEPVEE